MRVGILGGGQLGRMLALAGYPLGLHVRFFDPAEQVCVDELGPRVRAEYDDFDALASFAQGLDVITYEFEHVPLEAARVLAATGVPLYPPIEALEVAQDRLVEKRFLNANGVPTAPFEAVDSLEGLRAAVSRLGLPAVLKTRRFGYDGKGQWVLRSPADIEAAWAELGGVPLILEGFVAFQRELSVLAVRAVDGAVAYYPLVANHHADGILRYSIAPARAVSTALQSDAEALASHVLTALRYVGVLAIELFEVDGRLVANEIAPRVHNSGHWTIEGADTSQFENHLRAVAGLPLGSAAARGCSVMVNFIGALPPIDAVAAVPGAHVHLYDKAPRLGRKIGHVTLCAANADGLASRMPQFMRTLSTVEGISVEEFAP